MPQGVPTFDKFDQQRQEKYLALVRGGMRRGPAADAVGVSRCLLWQYRKVNAEFVEAEVQAEMDACDIIEDALFNEAKEGNVRACETWLFNRSSDRWADKKQVDARIDTRQQIEFIEVAADPRTVIDVTPEKPAIENGHVNGESNGHA